MLPLPLCQVYAGGWQPTPVQCRKPKDHDEDYDDRQHEAVLDDGTILLFPEEA